jgi:hypothetical protein
MRNTVSRCWPSASSFFHPVSDSAKVFIMVMRPSVSVEMSASQCW